MFVFISSNPPRDMFNTCSMCFVIYVYMCNFLSLSTIEIFLTNRLGEGTNESEIFFFPQNIDYLL